MAMTDDSAPDARLFDRISGTVDRVTFHNEENGFAVLRVRVTGRKEPVAVVGHVPSVSAGEKIEAEGTWTTDKMHGLQFKAERLTTREPTGRDAVARFLGSGLIAGVGPAMAERIVQEFGAKALDVIETEPMRLVKVPGVGRQLAARIAESYRERKAVKEIMIAFQEKGVGTARAVRIWRHFGPDAVKVIEGDPYRLAREVRGIGFEGADEIAEKFGVGKTAPERLRAGVTYALEDFADNGHTAVPREEIASRAARLLGVAPEAVTDAIAEALRQGDVEEAVIDGVPCLAAKRLARFETSVAVRLKKLAEGRPPWGAVDVTRAIESFEKTAGKALSKSQREALQTVAGAKVAVITGGPGVGKTTLLDALLATVAARKITVALAAPTGRAARRMAEQTGREAKTIHRLLEIDPGTGGFRRGPGEPLEADLVVVDEASMVDVALMAALLEAMPPSAGLILVGDVDQLPSVGPGQVLADVIASGIVPVARLTEIFRQAEESRIIVNAHRINRGEMPEAPPPGEAADFYLVNANGSEDALAKILEVVGTRIPRRFGLDAMRDVQVITPMQKGLVGARNLNDQLAKLLNPAPIDSIERFGQTLAVGDKVMQVENDYDRDVFNGDLGQIRRIRAKDDELVVAFDGREVSYGLQDLEALQRAYAITIHKSQGSEYPAVVIPLVREHSIMLARNLLYTATTRGKALVVLVAEPWALETAVAGTRSRKRWTRLKDLLA
ncbi:SF1B family DNA helicase RecD2 [Chthonobacter rhizosphaerae]|uniref:SF1B family DNA helicase RecD2 n=1 Tax=Chthonobacter rhizosphaerae TaxID=2735553 RepID=UPI0015EF33EC|nr:ATP-dependent RecD-like DNA helicase [Chthonobacter rhizosphaerae]